VKNPRARKSKDGRIKSKTRVPNLLLTKEKSCNINLISNMIRRAVGHDTFNHSSSLNAFAWGLGEDGQLGHGDKR
jgi:hypothetical protein